MGLEIFHLPSHNRMVQVQNLDLAQGGTHTQENHKGGNIPVEVADNDQEEVGSRQMVEEPVQVGEVRGDFLVAGQCLLAVPLIWFPVVQVFGH